MKKYEYKVTFNDVENLNSYGGSGWEYSHPLSSSQSYCVLKRELLDEKPGSPETVRLKIVMEKCEYAVGGFIPRLYAGDKVVSNVAINPMKLRRDFTYRDIRAFGGYATDRELIKDTFEFDCRLENI